MTDILENVLIMILSVVFLVGGGFLALVVIGWFLKLKSGRREQDGLTSLYTEIHRQQKAEDQSADQKSNKQK